MECLNQSEWKQIKLLLGKIQPALYYAWGEDYNDNPKKAGQLEVACNCDASLYSFTDSPVWLHGRL
jgi:hypothetical protein